MTKRYDELIEVVPDPADELAPAAFSWRGRAYEVDERLTSWREAGEWWNGRAEMRDREYFRVLAHPAGVLASGDVDADGFLQRDMSLALGAVYEVYRDRVLDIWRIARVWD